jgi:hypothetical protein
MSRGIVPSNPASEAARAQLAAQMAKLSPGLRGFIASQYANAQIAVLDQTYHSKVRFAAVRAAGPPATFTIDTTQRKAFAYAIGQDMAVAGRSGTIATPADTNLLTASQTRDNSDYLIEGISAFVTPDSEPSLLARLVSETDLELSLNGTQSIPIGRLEMFPGGGGLYGTGRSFIKSPDLATPGASNNGQGAAMGFVQNGNPMAGNYRRFNQPYKWAAVGSAGSDSSLAITLTPRRTIVETAMAARAAAAGVSAYDPPAAAGDLGTFVDVVIILHGVQVSRRSVNV